jgi:hypothetical protein
VDGEARKFVSGVLKLSHLDIFLCLNSHAVTLTIPYQDFFLVEKREKRSNKKGNER